MKRIIRNVVIVGLSSLILCAGSSFADPPVAEPGAGNTISVSPSQISIAGIAGSQSVKRTLFLRAGAKVSGLRAVSMDLYSDDGHTVMPASAIDVEPPKAGFDANGILSVPVALHLENCSSGEFKGQFLLQYQGGEIAIPLTVKVKDHFGWPLAIMIAGVALGMIVSAYRKEGKPRDEALVRIDRIRKTMSQDEELQKTPFHARADGYLADAAADLQNQRFADAKAVLQKTEDMLSRWRKGKTEWIAQFDYWRKLEEKTQGMRRDAAYRLIILRDLGDIYRNAPDEDGSDEDGPDEDGPEKESSDKEGPGKLRNLLDSQATRINTYLRLENEYLRLESAWNELDDKEQREAWSAKLLHIQRRLEELSPDGADTAGVETVRLELENAVAEIGKLASKNKEATKGFRSAGGDEPSEIGEIRLAQPAPVNRHPSVRKKKWFGFSDARKRLKAFVWLTYGIAVAFLAFAGFGELYLANPVFGSDFWSDYSALMAWGFGAEASRASITEMVKGWGVNA